MESEHQGGPSEIPFAQRPRAERLAYLERWLEAARNAQRPVRSARPYPPRLSEPEPRPTVKGDVGPETGEGMSGAP